MICKCTPIGDKKAKREKKGEKGKILQPLLKQSQKISFFIYPNSTGVLMQVLRPPVVQAVLQRPLNQGLDEKEEKREEKLLSLRRKLQSCKCSSTLERGM